MPSHSAFLSRLESRSITLRLRISLAWKVLTRYSTHAERRTFHIAYGQAGEDLLLLWLLRMLGTADKPSYMDIGAHHPESLSNTALFYDTGSKGINIEPDPDLFQTFKRLRRRDTNLNVGVGPAGGTFDFFRMEHSGLNTFSRAEAERMAKYEHIAIKDVIPIEVRSITSILSELGTTPDILNIDVEGHELPIIQSCDFHSFRPKLLCIETIPFSSSLQPKKRTDIAEHLSSQGYFPIADTYINTIFVDVHLPAAKELRAP